jgi:hypothetical protein
VADRVAERAAVRSADETRLPWCDERRIRRHRCRGRTAAPKTRRRMRGWSPPSVMRPSAASASG